MMRQALSSGATVVGGHPQLESSYDASLHQIALVFDLAQEFDAHVDFHVDENDRADSLWLEQVLRATIARGWKAGSRSRMPPPCPSNRMPIVNRSTA